MWYCSTYIGGVHHAWYISFSFHHRRMRPCNYLCQIQIMIIFFLSKEFQIERAWWRKKNKRLRTRAGAPRNRDVKGCVVEKKNFIWINSPKRFRIRSSEIVIWHRWNVSSRKRLWSGLNRRLPWKIVVAQLTSASNFIHLRRREENWRFSSLTMMICSFSTPSRSVSTFLNWECFSTGMLYPIFFKYI